MKYAVTLNATVSKTINVTADSADQAEKKAQSKFCLNVNEKGERYTLDTGEVKSIDDE